MENNTGKILINIIRNSEANGENSITLCQINKNDI